MPHETFNKEIICFPMIKQNFAALFALISFIILMICEEGAAVDCQLIGNWGAWGDWSTCPTNPPIPMLNIQRRLRDCIPQPIDCTEVSQYNCNGPYSQVVTCDTRTSTAVATTTVASTTPLATTSTTTTTTTAAPTTSTTTTPVPTTPSTTTTIATTTTTSRPPNCCGALTQNVNQANFADGEMRFVYNDNTCRTSATVTCSQPQVQGLEQIASIVVNQVNYVETGIDTVSLPATCVNGIWQMGQPPLNVMNLECRLSDSITTTTTPIPTSPRTTTTSTTTTSTTTAAPTTTSTTTPVPTTTSTTTTTPVPTTPSTTTTTAAPTTPSTTTTTTAAPTTQSSTTSTTTTTAAPTITTTLTQILTTISTTLFPSSTPTTTVATPTVPTDPACAGTEWNTWLEWSNCTDTCGSCGTHQRFRACTKAAPTCRCPGSAIDKTVCNTAVCLYPRSAPCCENYAPFSQDGQFVCVLNSTISTLGRKRR